MMSSLSATTTSRMRRQQRLQQTNNNRTPTKPKQQQLRDNNKSKKELPQRSRSHIPSPVAILIGDQSSDDVVVYPKRMSSGSTGNGTPRTVTPTSHHDSPSYAGRSSSSGRSGRDFVSPTRLQYNNASPSSSSSPAAGLVSSRSRTLSPSYRSTADAMSVMSAPNNASSSSLLDQSSAYYSATDQHHNDNNNNDNENDNDNDDEEMPMDEMMATLKPRGPTFIDNTSSNTNINSNSNRRHQHQQLLGDSSMSSWTSFSKQQQQQQQQQQPISRLIMAIQQNVKEVPPNLNSEERALWEVMQIALASQRQEQTQKRRQLERQFQEMANKYDKIRQRERQLQKQLAQTGAANKAAQEADDSNNNEVDPQEENDRAFRAIQRVLADVTTERDTLVEKLTNDMQTMAKQSETTTQQLHEMRQLKEEQLLENLRLKEELDALKQTVPSILDKANEDNAQELKQALQLAEKDKITLQRELDAKHSRMISAERALKMSKVALKQHEKKDLDLAEKKDEQTTNLALELDEAKKEIASLKLAKKELRTDLEARNKQLEDYAQVVGDESHTERELMAVKKQLEEKSASLENAKMIIASLENANGSLAVDLRAKLKEKEDELNSVQTTAADRKRMLDSIATELRELQLQQGDVDMTDKRNRELCTRHKKLSALLERNVKALRSAAVMHEARGDAKSVDKISAIVSETFTALKASVESSDELLTGMKDNGNVMMKDAACQSEKLDDNSETVKELMLELANKKNIVIRLEERLAEQTNQTHVIQADLDHLRQQSKEECNKLQKEICGLRDQCKTNMEVLAKKSNELEVLRDSLKVEDGVGYISDDGSDDDDDEDANASAAPSVASPLPASSSQQYDQSQAEAIATLLSHSGTGIEVNLQDNDEVSLLKSELLKAQSEKDAREKELQSEKESLTNAKMIISSLEKANKSMMEDLRSRLQDSNTAIASLLEKSMEHEQTSANLRSEVDRLKQEKLDMEQKSRAENSKLRDENLLQKMQLDTKHQELEDLRAQGYGGAAAVISPSVEEKKEDNSTSTTPLTVVESNV